MTSRSNLVYLSGPMMGLPEFNYPAFHAKARELREAGLSVVNPAEFGAQDDMKWPDYLRRDIRALMDCAAIWMMPGWSRSKGARLEHHIACELGMVVVYEAPE